MVTKSGQTFIDWDKFSLILMKAVASGGTIETHRASWDASQGCNKPYQVVVTSMPPESAVSPIQVIHGMNVRSVYIDTPCRKCQPCMDNRRRLWTRRAKLEIRAAPRTWFLTFTVNPHYRFLFSIKSGSRDYMDTHGVISKELTKYFKRLRKSGAKFRFVLVAEAHKDGYPHFHALLHESGAGITKSTLQGEWPYGFTTAKLVKDERAAHYVAKYLAKDARTRIRASLHYGLHVHDDFSAMILEQSVLIPTKSPKRIVF